MFHEDCKAGSHSPPTLAELDSQLMPTNVLIFPGYGSLAYAETCTSAWGRRLVNVGAAGHINAARNLGRWPEGWALLQQLRD